MKPDFVSAGSFGCPELSARLPCPSLCHGKTWEAKVFWEYMAQYAVFDPSTKQDEVENLSISTHMQCNLAIPAQYIDLTSQFHEVPKKSCSAPICLRFSLVSSRNHPVIAVFFPEK
ncbi:MAG: hypothetical protein GVY31_08650 [Alphaproteobacteria bacterium]|jgi:hypothetical protein|nr:hypothetical protein [Alphaproteobacteria bacterium]